MLGVALAGSGTPLAAQDYARVAELKTLSIEELARVEVTTVSKRGETLSGAPAAIYVITNEDIVRSAAQSIPEVLRQAPNLVVQRIDARQFSVSARGFNGVETANKMLALIDGRTIYSPLASSVFWELHQPLLEDIDQIEVVSGPGGTLYGPNAVNGVINIQTRSALETVGGMARGTVAANQHSAALRYGTAVNSGAIRVYGNYFSRAEQPSGPGGVVDDRFSGYQIGLRGDFGAEDRRFTISADHFGTDVATGTHDGESGQNVVLRWSRRAGENTSFQLQAYYDQYRRTFTRVRDELQTLDVEGQINVTVGRHELVAGGGLRTTRDLFENRLNAFLLDPERKRLWIGNAFVQDKLAIADDLFLTAGVKLEQSSFTGLQVLPSVRVAWAPSSDTLIWGAVSRAVRTPSRIDRQLVNLPLLATSPAFTTEKLTALEGGYRGQPAAWLSLSVSGFVNRYDDLRTTEFTGPAGGLPIRLQNSLFGTSYGLEAWATMQAAARWRLRLGASTLVEDFEVRGGRRDLTNGESAGNNPSYSIVARSTFDVTSRLSVDGGLRVVDRLSRFATPAYVEADARLGWRATDLVELFVAGSNLLNEDHLEANDVKRAQRVERTVLAGARLTF
ncbi:TonB-dependent receptor plug domain-containing protein [Sphingomonas sp.]|jgi:iron complex outermembrane receptor protein|uniref:TonB-dependent receptor plug domain-containing protein n=1 Tax=Sphingomonas sp. TaxID=28214 RepID=UPI002D81163B|nr:TonB-dependent receptor [Sphingomonas sp.]HEU0045806.1 TonB-dependent receptor [Sphingomonas sp.]